MKFSKVKFSSFFFGWTGKIELAKVKFKKWILKANTLFMGSQLVLGESETILILGT